MIYTPTSFRQVFLPPMNTGLPGTPVTPVEVARSGAVPVRCLVRNLLGTGGFQLPIYLSFQEQFLGGSSTGNTQHYIVNANESVSFVMAPGQTLYGAFFGALPTHKISVATSDLYGLSGAKWAMQPSYMQGVSVRAAYTPRSVMRASVPTRVLLAAFGNPGYEARFAYDPNDLESDSGRYWVVSDPTTGLTTPPRVFLMAPGQTLYLGSANSTLAYCTVAASTVPDIVKPGEKPAFA